MWRGWRVKVALGFRKQGGMERQGKTGGWLAEAERFEEADRFGELWWVGETDRLGNVEWFGDVEGEAERFGDVDKHGGSQGPRICERVW